MKKTGKYIKCAYCGEEVYKKKRDILKYKVLYCNDKCYTEGGRKGRVPWNKGMKGEYENNPSNHKKNEIIFDKNNRGWIYMPKHPKAHRGRVLRARYLIEQLLGRYLTSKEVVHHLNHNPNDDRIDNLYLTNRSEHALIHKING